MSKQDMSSSIRSNGHGSFEIEPPLCYEPPTDVFLQTREGVELVRLFDVFKWLQVSSRIPASEAAQRVCEALRENEDKAQGWLFNAGSRCYPKKFNIGELFCDCGFSNEMERLECGLRCLGFKGFLRIIAGAWVQGLECLGYESGRRVCLPWSKAHELWAWGRVVTERAQPAPANAATKPKKIKEKDKSPEWTGKKLDARRTELQKAKHPAWAAQTAKEAGLNPREVTRRIDAYKRGGVFVDMANQLKGADEKS